MTREALSVGMDEPAAALETRPAVARAAGGPPTHYVVVAFVLLAILLFVLLNGRRGEAQARSLVAPTPDAAASEPAPPLELPRPPEPPPPAAAAAPITPPGPRPALAPTLPVGPQGDGRERYAAPAVVVDLGARPMRLAQAPAAGAGAPAPVAEASPAASMARALEGQTDAPVEGMAQGLRIGAASSGAAVATPMGHLGLTVPQGAVIPAVLETAINSDLPGYTRALVSRDVYSFDGRSVLIPRGSRLIGQYRSAVALGQSRAFVIWSRVIRPDGVSVMIGSPGGDELGRAGLTGKVDRHFFTRFGGSILLSVLNAAVASIGDAPTTTIAIGSPGQATAAAATVEPERAPPTIKVAQGEAIRIFVARDLDFSAVGAAR